MTQVQLFGETNAEFRKRLGLPPIDDVEALFRLKTLLSRLGIKSAKTGIRVNFAGMNIRVPGVYSNVKVGQL